MSRASILSFVLLLNCLNSGCNSERNQGNQTSSPIKYMAYGGVGWDLIVKPRAKASLSKEQDIISVNVERSGKKANSVQLRSTDILLERNITYYVSFDLKSNSTRSIKLILKNKKVRIKAASKKVDPTNNFQQFKYKFTNKKNRRKPFQFVFQLGNGSNRTIEIRNFRFSDISIIEREDDGSVDSLTSDVPKASIPDYICEPNSHNIPSNFLTIQPVKDKNYLGNIESEHFVIRWPDTLKAESRPSQEESLDALIELEKIWAFFIEEKNLAVPFAKLTPHYKVILEIIEGGWAYGSGIQNRYGAMWLHKNALKDIGALSHEFTHVLQYGSDGLTNSPYVGWSWESHANFHQMQYQYYNEGSVNFNYLGLINAPHLYYGSTRNRYQNFHFFHYIKDEYCFQAVDKIWTESPKRDSEDAADADPLLVLKNVLGWNLKTFNDAFAWMALKNATQDYKENDALTNLFNYQSKHPTDRHRITILDKIEGTTNQYIVPSYYAPQRLGYNLVRLYPKTGSIFPDNTNVTVKLQGLVQSKSNIDQFKPLALVPEEMPIPNSGWRLGMVALNFDGTRSYAPVKSGSKSQIRFPVNSNIKELWFIVLGAPTEYQKIFWDQAYMSIYRYPWLAKIDGALPHGYEPGFNPLAQGIPYSRHPNGGGYVADSASVAPSVFVDKFAVVLNGTISGNTRIEDTATIENIGVIKDEVVVSMGSWINNPTAEITDNAKIQTVYNSGNVLGFGDYVKFGKDTVLYGDAEFHIKDEIAAGQYSGFMDQGLYTASYGKYLIGPIDDVTKSNEELLMINQVDLGRDEPDQSQVHSKVIKVCLYEHSDFQGNSRCFETEGIFNIIEPEWNDRVSSIQLFGSNVKVSVFEHIDLGGKQITLSSDALNLVDINFNDFASSIEIRK